MMEDVDFKVGLVGPTRVGKTSLLVSVLDQSQQLLAGTPVSMKPASGTATEKRLISYRMERQGRLSAREFHVEGLVSTQETSEYRFILDTGFDHLTLGFIDYPGGWLDSTTRGDEDAKNWEREIEPWIDESTILIVPIDAAVLMEAIRPKQKRSVPYILTLPVVEEVVRMWTKKRSQRPVEPALVVFAPVKCESYFNDNGGHRDRSQQLSKAFEEYYKPILNAIQQEKAHSNHILVLYNPIDTYGCVEFVDAEWLPNPSRGPDILNFKPRFGVKEPAEIRVKGADTILISICSHICGAKRQAELSVASDKTKVAEEWHRKVKKEEDRNFFSWWYYILSGQRAEDLREAKKAKVSAEEQAKLVKKFDTLVHDLARRPLDGRCKWLS
jgi:hypothetical protein